MPPGEFDLLWPVASRGYFWADDVRATPGSEGSPPFLIAAADEGRLYRPLETFPELYLRFAELAGERDLQGAIAKFAETYGALGIGGPVYYHKRGGSPVISGESLVRWQLEIRWFAEALKLWESNDTKWLRKHIRWRPGGVDFISETGAFAIIADRDKRIRPEAFQQWKSGDLEGPARLHLLSTVNKTLKGEASPQLVISGAGIEPRTVPHNLLGAIWLQLFDLIHGSKRARRCSFCGKLMDVTGEKRPKRMHASCSNKKRQQEYKKRREGGK
jgi:hypothetical protein